MPHSTMRRRDATSCSEGTSSMFSHTSGAINGRFAYAPTGKISVFLLSCLVNENSKASLTMSGVPSNTIIEDGHWSIAAATDLESTCSWLVSIRYAGVPSCANDHAFVTCMTIFESTANNEVTARLRVSSVANGCNETPSAWSSRRVSPDYMRAHRAGNAARIQLFHAGDFAPMAPKKMRRFTPVPGISHGVTLSRLVSTRKNLIGAMSPIQIVPG